MTVTALSSAAIGDIVPSPLRAATFAGRRDLLDLLRQICREVSADRYMLVDLADRGDRPRIIASNWVFDMIETIGMAVVGRIAGSLSFGRSQPPTSITADDQRLLTKNGHAELIGLPLRVGGRRFALLLSAETTGSLVERALAKARLVCSYALSLLTPSEPAAEATVTLSDRERECLHWVAEGKTTEEIGMILGVSPNTANGYVSSAIQRLGAKNRALAVATAIRKGLI